MATEQRWVGMHACGVGFGGGHGVTLVPGVGIAEVMPNVYERRRAFLRVWVFPTRDVVQRCVDVH